MRLRADLLCALRPEFLSVPGHRSASTCTWYLYCQTLLTLANIVGSLNNAESKFAAEIDRDAKKPCESKDGCRKEDLHNSRTNGRNDKSATLIVHLHHWIEATIWSPNASSRHTDCFISFLHRTPSRVLSVQRTKTARFRKPQESKYEEVGVNWGHCYLKLTQNLGKNWKRYIVFYLKHQTYSNTTFVKLVWYIFYIPLQRTTHTVTYYWHYSKDHPYDCSLVAG